MRPLPAPSKYQRAILEQLTESADHLVIHATAGAGKTTVLEQISRSQPPDSRQLFLAFARDAASELKKRLPAGVDTRTVHSLGRQITAQALRSRNIELLPPQPAKYRKLAQLLLKEREPELDSPDARHFLSELASAVRLQLAAADDTDGLRELMAERGLWAPCSLTEVDRLFQLVPQLLQMGLEQAEQGRLDFGDMLFVPVRKRMPVPMFDLVCVDEAQDYSPVALELTLSLATAGARLVFVGDPRQSIFGFAGADPDAMKLISERLAARVMPLSVTYRCPRLHVELARVLAPEMEAAPGAIAGSVHVVEEAELEAWVKPGDLILCRLNAPLIATSLKLSAAGLPTVVRGSDLKNRLLKLASRIFATFSPDPLQQLRRFEAAERRRLAAGELTAPVVALERLRDESRCLEHLCSALPPDAGLPELNRAIETAFGGNQHSVVLSTIHRAKGQEADRVILLYPELLPAPYARSLRALRGEACVQFVALTRARRELVLVEAAPSAPERPRSGLSAPNEVTAEVERDGLLEAWQTVLFKAKAGRRHRRGVIRS